MSFTTGPRESKQAGDQKLSSVKKCPLDCNRVAKAESHQPSNFCARTDLKNHFKILDENILCMNNSKKKILQKSRCRRKSCADNPIKEMSA
jgi:hypothetical protein